MERAAPEEGERVSPFPPTALTTIADDEYTARRGRRRTERREFLPDATDDDIVAWIKDHPTSMFHPVGTARKGSNDDPDAVLDPDLRVKGVVGLRVADASAMPSTIRGHTMAPVVYIAERASALIREQRRT